MVTADQNTAAIQQAIDSCGSGTVEFSATKGTDFTSGPLFLPSNARLWLDTGVTLHASTNPTDFQRTATSRTAACDGGGAIPACGTLASGNTGCVALINACNVTNAGVGGTGTIEGHGWTPLTGGPNAGTTWWALASAAKAGNYAQSLNAPQMLHFVGSSGITLSGFTIHNAPLVHIRFEKSQNISVSQVTIATPTPDHVISSFPYNSDGFDFSGSSNIAVDRVDIADGDDNIAFEGGGSGPVSNALVTNSIFRAGHGLSIGSPTNSGVTGLTANNIYFTGTDNGLRIKSYAGAGGLVDQIQYNTTCIKNVKDPIVIDAYYSSPSGTTLPMFRNVAVQDLYADGGALTFHAYAGQPALALTLNNVRIDGLKSVIAGNVNVSEVVDPRFNFPILIPNNASNAVSVTQTQATAPAPADMKSFCAAGQALGQSGTMANVTSAASYATGAVPADSIVSIFAPGLAQSGGQPAAPTMTVTDSNGVQLNGDILSAAPQQINAHLPAGLAAGPGVIGIRNFMGVMFWSPIVVSVTAPGIFSANASGSGAAAAQLVTNHANGTQTLQTNQCGPSAAGICTPLPMDLGAAGDLSALVLYGTGLRNAPAGSVTVMIGSQTLTPFYAGPAPAWIGLDQVNVLIPRSLAGQQKLSVTVTAGGVTSNAVTVSFK